MLPMHTELVQREHPPRTLEGEPAWDPSYRGMGTASTAATRLTASGRVQGAAQRISVDEALYAITMGAAITMKMDDRIGSIEVGKRADFAVLEDDPAEATAEGLKDLRVWGTVQGGRIFAADSI